MPSDFHQQDVIETVRSTTILIITKCVESRLAELTRDDLENRLRILIREELSSLMKTTEELFVKRVAESLVEAVQNKLQEPTNGHS
jgi:hypothetical protein